MCQGLVGRVLGTLELASKRFHSVVTDNALREIQELHRDLASKGSGDKRLSLRREFPAIESGAQIRQEQAAHPMSYPSQANVSDLLLYALTRCRLLTV